MAVEVTAGSRTGKCAASGLRVWGNVLEYVAHERMSLSLNEEKTENGLYASPPAVSQ